MPVLSTTQLTLNFEAGLADQADSLKEFVREYSVPGMFQKNGIPRKYIAADMGLSPSELTRKLSDNPNDPRNFTTDDLELYLRSTKDLSPVFYLLDKYGRDNTNEIAQLEARLAELKAGKKSHE